MRSNLSEPPPTLPASGPRRRGWALAPILFLALAACTKEETPVVSPDPPPASQIRDDLAGVRFAFFEDEDGPRFWTIEDEEIRRLAVVDQAVDDSGRVARSRVSLVLRAENRSILGDLVLRHRREGPNWVLEEAGRAGPNWRAADAAATLFAVRVLSDSTQRRRSLALDPIARYERGRYLDPLAPFRPQAVALFDSTFASDSLRDAAEAALNRRVGASLAGRAAFLLGPGHAPVRASVDSVQVSLLGCQYATLFATPSDASASGWAVLATSSSVMGTPTASGTSVPRDLTRALESVARQRFDLMGVDASRLRSKGTLAADLDGDGQDEAVGAFVVGQGERQVGLGLAVEMVGGQPRLLFERQATRTDGFWTLELLGVLDVDADGADEVLFLEEGYEVFRYLIVTYRADRFTDAFRGGGGGC